MTKRKNKNKLEEKGGERRRRRRRRVLFILLGLHQCLSLPKAELKQLCCLLVEFLVFNSI